MKHTRAATVCQALYYSNSQTTTSFSVPSDGKLTMRKLSNRTKSHSIQRHPTWGWPLSTCSRPRSPAPSESGLMENHHLFLLETSVSYKRQALPAGVLCQRGFRPSTWRDVLWGVIQRRTSRWGQTPIKVQHRRRSRTEATPAHSSLPKASQQQSLSQASRCFPRVQQRFV